MPGPLYAFVDWAKDGTFGAAPSIDDVSDRVRDDVVARYGRDTSTPTIVAGEGSFDLDNRTRAYSPQNTGSPVYPNVKPARPVLVQRTVGATTYTIFRGRTDKSPIDPKVGEKRVTLSLIDNLASFRGVTISTPLYQGVRSGQAIGYVLDALGWTGGRDLDAGASVFPYWWADGADAADELQKILASEGPPALLTMDTSGAVVFRDRHHRLTRTASTTPQTTFREAGTEPVMQDMTYSSNWASVVNSVQLAVDVRAPGRRMVNVWESDDVFTIPASSSIVVVMQASDPFLGAVAPIEGTDFDVISGSVTGTSLSRTSGLSTSVTLTAGAGGASLNGLALRAYSVPVARTVQVSASDATSITDYDPTGLPSGLEPVWCNQWDAKAIADLWVLTRKQPPVIITASFVCQHTQTTKLAALLARNLSDQVTVIETETSTNGPFFVEKIAHTISDVTEHTIEFTCEQVPAAPASAFILGTSTLNGATPLGY